MWAFETRALAQSVIAVTTVSNDERMTFADVVSGWSTSPEFTARWVAALNAIPFEAYCWESPPLTASDLDRAFECVLVDSPALTRVSADSAPFEEHFKGAHGCVVFPSLGKDATLIAPCPDDASTSYAHLAAFLRSASTAQVEELWQALAFSLRDCVRTAPLWLSTAGLGVSWLHVRLDSRPKYYRYRPYTSPQFWGSQK